MDRRALLRRGGLVAALGLAGCTGSPDETDAETDEPTDSPTPTDATGGDGATATPTDTATETPSPTPATNPEQRVVVGPDGKLRFDPESFTVSTGDTVLWEWASGGHNVSPTSQPAGSDWPGKDEEFSYASGTVHRYAFDEPGEYTYVCQPHQSAGMRGSFTVE